MVIRSKALTTGRDVLRFLLRRRVLASLVILVAALMGLRAGLSHLVPTAGIKDRIEAVISDWTGHRAVISGDPQFTFWPSLKVTVSDVHILNTDEAELASVESISAEISLLAAFGDKPVFSDFRLVGPVVRIERAASGKLNWSKAGLIAKASAGDAESAAQELGTVTVTDGMIMTTDNATKTSHRFEHIDGSVNWPVLASRLDINLRGISSGQAVNWVLACDQPLLLLTGHAAGMRTSITSQLLTANFEGTANISATPFMAGRLTLGTPSLSTLLSRFGSDSLASDKLGAFDAEADVNIAADLIKLDGLRLGIQDANASGVLDIALKPGSLPRVSGTLAFDQIDLKSVLLSLSPASQTSDPTAEAASTRLIRQVDLDLRLSARRALFSPFEFTDFAAGARIADGRASLDIGDSTVEGGRMSGRIALSAQGPQGSGDLQISLRDTDLGSIARTLGIAGPLPLGRGSADLRLSSSKPFWSSGNSDLSGSLKINIDDGAIERFNVATFEKLAEENGFFSAAQVADGSFSFTQADISAKLENGLAELTQARIAGPLRSLQLSGFIPYSSGSLALAGTLENTVKDSAADAGAPLHFFVGGSWPEPLISPVSILTEQNGP